MMHERVKNKIQEITDDIFFYSGSLFLVAVIFLMRDLSIAVGAYLPFSGNLFMRYTDFEPWRVVMFLVVSAYVACLFILQSRKSPKEAMKEYSFSFIRGMVFMAVYEMIFHMIGYRLGTAKVLF